MEELIKEFGPGELFTGHVEEIGRMVSPDIKVVKSPNQVTSSNVARIMSWLHYCVFVFFNW